MFGVCYYPEHWPESQWPSDAQRMTELGLTYVRVAEFAWSRLEPEPERFEFGWLDRAIETLQAAGLKVVMCTPTATPPRWLIGRYPDVLPIDPDSGRPRDFGSRRHYDFSSPSYRREALRITRVVADRYGEHAAVVGWQTDNELCCHDTTMSASPAALAGFREWCRQRYGSIEALNRAWGNVFWSMEYSNFDDIGLPFGAVTETSPAHGLAYRRYCSDTVVAFHADMVAEIRARAPGRFVTHNFIPAEDTGVDDFAVAAPLDFASYDNYPLGRTDLKFADADAEEFRRYMRKGHPDFASFLLDQARGLRGPGLWVMEQQPGPVNWADSNPRPAPGMIRLWSLEAIAHGADVVSYFRWRQAPFAQEQMHAGLRRPDDSPSAAWPEVTRTIADARRLSDHLVTGARPPVAIVTGAEGHWLADLEKQSRFYRFDDVSLSFYRALRQLGVDVDFVSANGPFDDYQLIVCPCLPIVPEGFTQACVASSAHWVFGPRSGSKDDDFCIPHELAPGALQSLLSVRVLSVETLRPDVRETLAFNGEAFDCGLWCEELEAPDCEVVATYADGAAAAVRNDRFTYLGVLGSIEFLTAFFEAQCEAVGVETVRLDNDLRIARRGDLVFAFNYADVPKTAPASASADFLLGEAKIPPNDVAVWLAE